MSLHSGPSANRNRVGELVFPALRLRIAAGGRKVDDEARYSPIWEWGFLCASSPGVAESGLGLMPVFIYSAPYEEVHLKSCKEWMRL
jgi:hypothetical protein